MLDASYLEYIANYRDGDFRLERVVLVTEDVETKWRFEFEGKGLEKAYDDYSFGRADVGFSALRMGYADLTLSIRAHRRLVGFRSAFSASGADHA